MPRSPEAPGTSPSLVPRMFRERPLRWRTIRRAALHQRSRAERYERRIKIRLARRKHLEIPNGPRQSWGALQLARLYARSDDANADNTLDSLRLAEGVYNGGSYTWTITTLERAVNG